MSKSRPGLFRRHQIGVCGSSSGLQRGMTELCTSLGHCLGRERNIVIVAGSTKAHGAEAIIVKAAATQMPAEQAVERILLYAEIGQTNLSGVGTFRTPTGQTSEARRISFVLGVDALIAVSGGNGTSQELALALEFGIKVLPVPAFGRAAGEFWKAYKSEIMKTLGIDDSTAKRWENPASYRGGGCDAVAQEMVGALLQSLPRRCFVMMPFRKELTALYDDVVKPVVEAAGDLPIRLDRDAHLGSAYEQIEAGIRTCDYAVGVLDHLSPNVMYEVGMAHAFRKPVILVNREGGIGDADVPFNIHGQQRLQYSDATTESFRERLADAIRQIGRR